jgi:hypothetical protein
MANKLHEERNSDSPDLNRNLAKGEDLVARFIGGATVGALAGGAFTAGSGIVPGAVVGGLVGTVVPEVVSRFGGWHNGHHNGHKS